MFERIIVASEIMKGEKQLIKCLSELEVIGAKHYLLLQCLNRNEIYAQMTSFVKRIYESVLMSQKEQLEKLGLQVETRIVSGDMKEELLRIAEDENYALIVAAAAEHTLTGELIFGGVAHDVIYHSSKPVLLVRISESPDGLPAKEIKECHLMDHILFPTDFSENASFAFEYLKKMVVSGAKKVTLVHVQDQTKIDPYLIDLLDEFNEKDTKRLNALKAEIKEISDIEVDVKLIYGSPSADLLKLIRDLKVPIVVMGNQGRGYVQEIFLGSVSHNIVRHSSASVLLIPAIRK